MDFKQKLHKTSEDLRKENVAELKFLFGECLGKSKLQDVTDGIGLFDLMMENGTLGKSNCASLRKALQLIGREDLSMEYKNQGDINTISEFRILLYKIAADFHPQDLDRVRFLLDIPKGQRMDNVLDMLTFLLEKTKISKTDTKVLQKCLGELHRKDLEQKLKEYHQATTKRTTASSSNDSNDIEDDGAGASKSEEQGASFKGTKGTTQEKAKRDIHTTASSSDGSSDIEDFDDDAWKLEKPGAPFDGCLAKSRPERELVEYTVQIVKAARSVGLIGETGTGFMVGGESVMTAAHVLYRALDLDYDKNHRQIDEALNNQKLLMTFTIKNEKKRFRIIELRFVDKDIDVAIARLKKTGGNFFPPALSSFWDIHEHNFKFELIGHDAAAPQAVRDMNCYTILNEDDFATKKAKLEDYGFASSILEPYDTFGEDPDFIEFHCSMKHGASGSPGVCFQNGQLYVMTMLLKGYPEGIDLRGKYVELGVERGVRMEAIREKISMKDESLYKEIFPNGVAEPMEM